MIPETNVTTPQMVTAPPVIEWPVIPGYHILAELGRGGMGVVYKAHQTALNRVVAIKMILTDSEVDDRIRFLGEAEAVAAIEHPNVVRIHAFGQTDDRPYLVMEFVGGGSLAHLLRECKRLPARSAASLVSRVARGVQAAHDCGIIHRDLKPGNILLGTDDGARMRSDSETAENSKAPTMSLHPAALRPKITDFGVAKRGRSQDITLTGIAMGTPAYMAPEQASCQTNLLGPRSDVHALGAILFECLTGQVAFDGDTPEMIMYRVVQRDAPMVRQFAASVPRDLELICGKCLTKNPEQRYESAAALADDLDRFLAGDPVSVASPGRFEKAVRWIRKHPTLASAYALAALALMFASFTAVAVSFWFEANGQRDKAEAALRDVREAQQRADEQHKAAESARSDAESARSDANFIAAVRATDLAYREFEFGNLARARQLLDSCPPRLRSWEWHFVNRLVSRQSYNASLPQRLSQMFATPSEVVLPKAEDVPSSVAISSDGRHILIAGNTTVRALDSRTARVIATVEVPVQIACVTFDFDPSTVIIFGRDGSVHEWAWREGRLTEMRDQVSIRVAELLARFGINHRANIAMMSPHGSRVATGSEDGTVRLWDAHTGAELRLLASHTAAVKDLSFNPDATRLVSVCSDGSVRVWDVRTGFEVLTLRTPLAGTVAAGWSPDGSKLVVVGPNIARILDATPPGK